MEIDKGAIFDQVQNATELLINFQRLSMARGGYKYRQQIRMSDHDLQEAHAAAGGAIMTMVTQGIVAAFVARKEGAFAQLGETVREVTEDWNRSHTKPEHGGTAPKGTALDRMKTVLAEMDKEEAEGESEAE